MDGKLLNYLNQSLAHPWLDGLMLLSTTLGLAVLPLCALFLLCTRRHRRLGWTLVLGMALTLVCTLAFQFLVLRPRPEAVRLILPQPPGFFSFPSGHASLVFSFAAVLVLAWRHTRWSAVVITLAVLVSVSRIYLGHHYPSDVLGGMMLGIGGGATVYGLIHVRAEWPAKLGMLIWMQIGVAATICLMAYMKLLPTRLLTWPFSDKVIHFLLVGSFAFWLNLLLRGRRIGRVPLAILLPGALAFIEEGLQFFSPVRNAGPGDMLSNILGLCCFWLISEWVLKVHPLPADVSIAEGV